MAQERSTLLQLGEQRNANKNTVVMTENLFQLLISFLLANFTFQVIFIELAAKVSQQNVNAKHVSLKLESS